ncbi:hypothetical protein D3C80_1576490 [compost metagenome]
MQHNQPHSLQHTVIDPAYDLVADLLMGNMAPPYQYICVIQHFFCQSMLRFIQCRCSCIEPGILQKSGNLGMDAQRIDLADTLFLELMPVLIPYGYSCHYRTHS